MAIGYFVELAVKAKRRHDLAGLIDGITEGSLHVNMSREGIKNLYYLSEKDLKTADFNAYITTTPWLREAGVDFSDKHTSKLFGKNIITAYNLLSKKSGKDTPGKTLGLIGLYVLNTDGSNSILLEGQNNPKRDLITLPAIKDKHIQNAFYTFASGSLEQGTPLTKVVSTINELYSLDNKNPAEALKRYTEKHPY
ncbi:MAG: hypothetical protein M1433_02265 [Candidatus Parvarchaeota archaeon]|nr:hypothetical protein [Candidatus Parvarchaeota archaeon]